MRKKSLDSRPADEGVSFQTGNFFSAHLGMKTVDGQGGLAKANASM
jgi:hypothetical protein